MPRPKRRQTLSALDLVEFLSKAEDESVTAPTNNVLNAAKDDTNMLSKIKQSGNEQSSLGENYAGSVRDVKCSSNEESANLEENERIVSEEDHIREFVKINFAERDAKTAKTAEVVELSKMVMTSTKYNLLSQRLMFPEKFPHEPSSLESKRALLLSMNSSLKEAEVQRNADVSACEAFTRCTCGKGRGKSSFEYKDIDTGKVITPEEYEIRYLTYLRSLRPHPAPLARGDGVGHSHIDLPINPAPKIITKSPTMLNMVPNVGEKRSTSVSGSSIVSATSTPISGVESSQPQIDGLGSIRPPSSISTTFSPIKTQPVSAATCSPLCGADAAIKSERANHKHKPRRMTLSPKSAQEMMLQALGVEDDATVERDQPPERGTPSVPVPTPSGGFPSLSPSPLQPTGSNKLHIPLQTHGLSAGPGASGGTRVGASLSPMAPTLPPSPIKCSPRTASQPTVGSDAAFESGPLASITGEYEGQDEDDDDHGCVEAAGDVIPPSVAPSPLDSLFCDDFTFVDFKYDKGRDKSRGRGKSQRKARESFLMPTGPLLDEDDILNMLESDAAMDQKHQQQQQQQQQHNHDGRKQSRKQEKELLEMEDSSPPIAPSQGQGQRGSQREGGNTDDVNNASILANSTESKSTVTMIKTVTCTVCHHVNASSETTCLSCENDMSMRRATRSQRRARESFVLPALHEDAIRDMLLGQAEEEEECAMRDVLTDQTQCCQLNPVTHSEFAMTLSSPQRDCPDSISRKMNGATQEGAVDALGSNFIPAHIGIDQASFSSAILDIVENGAPAEGERGSVDEDADEDADGDGGDIMSWMISNTNPEQAPPSAETMMEQSTPSLSSPSFTSQQQSSTPPTTSNIDDKLLNDFDLELGDILSGGSSSGEFNGEGDCISVSMCVPFNVLVRGLAVNSAPAEAVPAQCSGDITRSKNIDEELSEGLSLSCNRESVDSRGRVQWDQALGFGNEAESDSDNEDCHDGQKCHDGHGGHHGDGGDGSSGEICSELSYFSISSSSQSAVSSVPSPFERVKSLKPDPIDGREEGSSSATSVRVDDNAPLNIHDDTLLRKAENCDVGEAAEDRVGGSVSIVEPTLITDNELTKDENLHDCNDDDEYEEEEEEEDDYDQVQNVLHHREVEMRQFMDLEADQGLGEHVQAHPTGIANVGSTNSLNLEADSPSMSSQQEICVEMHNPSLMEGEGEMEEDQANMDIARHALSSLSDHSSLCNLSPQHHLCQDFNHEAVDVCASSVGSASPLVCDHNTESKTPIPQVHIDIATAAPQALQLLPTPLLSSHISKGQAALDDAMFGLDPADVTPDVDESCPASARGDAIAEVLRSCDLGDDVDVDVGAGTELFFVMDLEECFKRVVVEGAARESIGKAKTSILPLPVLKADCKSLSRKVPQGSSCTKQSGLESIAAEVAVAVAPTTAPPPSIGSEDRVTSPHRGSSPQVSKGIALGRKPKLPKGPAAAAAKVDFSPDEQIIFRKRRLSTERGRASLAGRSSVSSSTSATSIGHGHGLASLHQPTKASDRHTSRRASIHTMNGVAVPGGGNRSKKQASSSSSSTLLSSSTVNTAPEAVVAAAPLLATTIGSRSKQKREDDMRASKVKGSKSAITSECADKHPKLSVEIIRTAEQLEDEEEAMRVVVDLATARMLLRMEIARWKCQWEICSAHAAQCAQTLGLVR